MLILHLVVEKPGILLREVQTELLQVLLLEVDISTICRFLRENGFTRQKLRYIALQRDDYLRQKFVLDVPVYEPHMLIFLYETGADRRNILRKYGYSMRGKPAQKHAWFVRGERVSGIAIISVSGLLDVSVVKGTVDGDKFYHFVLKYLLPHLMPFNGVNSHSVVILDNCAIHHVEEITSMIEDVGALVQFLPPYSPDMNPIEEMFSKVKTEMKHMEASMTSIMDTETIALSAFSTVTPKDCQGWILNNHIYTQQ